MTALESVLDVLRLITPSLITISLGGLLVQRFFVQRANQALTIDFIVKDLNELKSNALNYWVKEEDPKDQRFLAQKIKGELRALNSDINYFMNRYYKSNRPETDFLMEEIVDACTGGDFESSQKKTDESRYIQVVNAINKMKAKLLHYKI